MIHYPHKSTISEIIFLFSTQIIFIHITIQLYLIIVQQSIQYIITNMSNLYKDMKPNNIQFSKQHLKSSQIQEEGLHTSYGTQYQAQNLAFFDQQLVQIIIYKYNAQTKVKILYFFQPRCRNTCQKNRKKKVYYYKKHSFQTFLHKISRYFKHLFFFTFTNMLSIKCKIILTYMIQFLYFTKYNMFKQQIPILTIIISFNSYILQNITCLNNKYLFQLLQYHTIYQPTYNHAKSQQDFEIHDTSKNVSFLLKQFKIVSYKVQIKLINN
eukprot:TRINITY_DN5040_c0_g3_i1.p1 TRINITY_DN5040_c0_g3~~TRINITY_DN5040_c0_g3_i1.p1  ORF type:complete len:268 (-),score=-38.38 TRINITY_DN5040_c0_g3_i1:254-1057(-)